MVRYGSAKPDTRVQIPLLSFIEGQADGWRRQLPAKESSPKGP